MSTRDNGKNIELEMINIDEVTQPEDRKSSLLSMAWMALYVVVLVCLFIIIIRFGFQRSLVEGESMKPTLDSGDNLLVDKFSYLVSEPKRYDVVVFLYDRKADTHYIKRVIGLPGETVQIKDGCVYIDGEKLSDDPIATAINNSGIAKEPVKLGDGEYFVLGDNRNESSDSRQADVGIVYKKQIEGKAWLRIWPFKSFGTVK